MYIVFSMEYISFGDKVNNLFFSFLVSWDSTYRELFKYEYELTI